LTSSPIDPTAEAYESLKDIRRRGELVDVSIIAPEKIQRTGSFARFLEIQTLARRVFGEEKATAWLNRTNSALSGQKPIDLLKDELGAAVVREALEQIDHGIFA
jgi:putative toxin-antitoxin system antitoxin component (TIGR02293 family)